MYFDVAKHVYDVSVMMGLPEIELLLNDPQKLEKMICYKRLEETRRIGSDLSDKPFQEYSIFNGIHDSKQFEDAFKKMQKNYVFNNEDILSKEFAIQQWEYLYKVLIALGI